MCQISGAKGSVLDVADAAARTRHQADQAEPTVGHDASDVLVEAVEPAGNFPSLPFLPECAAPRDPVDDHLEGEGLGTTEPSREGQ